MTADETDLIALARKAHYTVEPLHTAAYFAKEMGEALIINPRRFSFEIRGSLKLSDKTTLNLESVGDIEPAIAAKVLVHLIADKVPAIVRFNRGRFGQLRQASDFEVLLNHGRVEVRAPSHRPALFGRNALSSLGGTK